MKLSIALATGLAAAALAIGLTAVTQASAADRTVTHREHRTTVVRGAVVRGTAARLPPLALRTASRRFVSVMDSRPCWRACTTQCGADFQYCIRADWLAGCMVQNNACERACLVQCRPIGGPLVSWTDY